MFAIYEVLDNGRKRLHSDVRFDTPQGGVDFFGEAVCHFEIEPDNSAADIFTIYGGLFVVEKA